MAYVQPPTRSASDFLDADDWNADIGDTRAFLHDPPVVKVVRTSVQEIDTATFTDINFDTELYDTDNMHTTGGTTNRLTATTAGVYAITGNVSWEAVAGTSFRWLAIKHSNGNYIAAQYHRANNLRWDQSVAAIYKMAAADYVTLEVYQNSGGTLDINYVSVQPASFSMAWLGAGTA